MWPWRRAAAAAAPHVDPAEAAMRIADAEAALQKVKRQAEERKALMDSLRRTRQANDLAARIREAFGGDPR